MTDTPKIIYTDTDEAPRLATFSFLPIIKAFSDSAGVEVETRDISLAGRIVAAFPERMTDEQRIADDLAELGELTQRPEANIIKLPNISASTPQMHECIKELQDKGYDLPDYPEEPQTDEEREIRARYDAVKGSAVNPVLREGNSDRRAAKAVKEYARKYPHRMGEWSKSSKSHVSHMSGGDFYESERSVTMAAADTLSIVFKGADEQTLAEGIAVDAGEIVDAAFMSKRALCDFLAKEIAATEDGVLFSLHLKATMMKVSDPILFGHCVRTYYKAAFDKHAAVFEELGVDANNGVGDAYEKIEQLPAAQRDEIKADLDACLADGPDLAMVNSDKGITNLHVPSDIIIDASMPAAIRESGQMWGPDGELHDMKAVIPDRCYAHVYQETIQHCIKHGAFDPTTMGPVPNVGLMAQKAEEYGSHDTTFEMPSDGVIKVLDSAGKTLIEHQVEAGDVWRLSRVKDGPVQDWVKLAVKRARATGWPIVFWLDAARGHDAELIAKVNEYLPTHNLKGIEHHIMPPAEAARLSLERMRAGDNTISVTGNVLRDYLTDLFPILELGTSAKMLSIVPLINGGGLFETGAGGSAPKHVQQFEAEGHLRWDSLGEFLALGASLEHLADSFENRQAQILADTLNEAIAKFLESNRSPSRVVNEIDNRGSHYYLAMYWAEAVAAQDQDPSLKKRFGELAKTLAENEDAINAELIGAQGRAEDVGGYYMPDHDLASKAMRPSPTFNAALEAVMAWARCGKSGAIDRRPRTMTPIPTNLAEITQDWLCALLGQNLTLLAVEPLAGGYMSTLARVRLQDPGGALPPTLLIKLATEDSENLAMALAFDSYRKEVRFYQELAPELDVRTPKCHASAIAEDGSGLLLVLEDLGHLQAVAQIESASEAQTMQAMTALADLHASAWQRKDASLPQFAASVEASALGFTQMVIDAQHSTGFDLNAELGGELWRHIMDYIANPAARLPEFERLPQTLIHSDFRCANLFFAPDEERAVIFDWGDYCLGPAAFDLAIFLSTSLDPDSLLDWEADALRCYTDRLALRGIDYPLDKCLAHYRLMLLPCIHLPAMTAAGIKQPDLPLATELFRRYAAASA